MNNFAEHQIRLYYLRKQISQQIRSFFFINLTQNTNKLHCLHRYKVLRGTRDFLLQLEEKIISVHHTTEQHTSTTLKSNSSFSTVLELLPASQLSIPPQF